MGIILRFKGGKDVGRSVEFPDQETIKVGSSPTADLRVTDDPLIAGEHFLIEQTSTGAYLIRHLSADRHTHVNDEPTDVAPLRSGDIVRAGLTAFQVVIPSDEETTVRTDSSAERIPAASGKDRREEADDVLEKTTTAVGRVGYSVVEEMHRSSYCRVYRAARQASGQSVAIKVLDESVLLAPHFRALFLREMEALRALNHPHVVRLLKLGEPDDQVLWFAMEYVEGQDLAALVRSSGGVLDVADACTVTLQMLDALEYAHALPHPQGPIVHRDVKPSNILVSGSQGQYCAKLADLGLAKNFEAAGQSGISTTGDVRGTLAFMPPEQLKDSKYVGPEVDLYAMGCVLYFCFCGKYLYDVAETAGPSELAQAVLQHNVVPIRERCPQVPDSLACVIDQAIASDPTLRFHTASTMRQAVGQAFPGFGLK